MICYNCKGNGYVRLKFENEESIGQCKICHSQGELNEDNYYHHRDLHSFPNALFRSTRFRKSKPVIEFKGEPPF